MNKPFKSIYFFILSPPFLNPRNYTQKFKNGKKKKSDKITLFRVPVSDSSNQIEANWIYA
jgi:hypothetical protein